MTVGLKREALFEISELAYAAGGRVILGPVSLSLEAGQIHGLVGHNGSGKSTLLKLLARQQPPVRGSILHRGAALDGIDNRAFARRIAYLPQQTPPAPGLLVKELVAFGRYAWHGPLGRFTAEDRRKVDEAIDLTGIAAFADRIVDSLSGGERQRCWLAMLVAQDARCLLLDEPISALDIAHQINVLSLIRELADARGCSVVIVLHDINMAARFCSRIVALKAGRVVAEGPPVKIMSRACLQEIYGIDMEIFEQAGALAALPKFGASHIGTRP